VLDFDIALIVTPERLGGDGALFGCQVLPQAGWGHIRIL
jgi:hypothetical protein